MNIEMQLQLLKQANENNNELISLANKIRDAAKSRNDYEYVKKLTEDIETLMKIKQGFEQDRIKLEKEL